MYSALSSNGRRRSHNQISAVLRDFQFIIIHSCSVGISFFFCADSGPLCCVHDNNIISIFNQPSLMVSRRQIWLISFVNFPFSMANLCGGKKHRVVRRKRKLFARRSIQFHWMHVINEFNIFSDAFFTLAQSFSISFRSHNDKWFGSLIFQTDIVIYCAITENAHKHYFMSDSMSFFKQSDSQRAQTEEESTLE